MKDVLFESILSRIFHDMLSPISAVSLALESISDEVDQTTAGFMNASIEDFRTKISLFKLLTIRSSAETKTVSTINIIDEDAKKSRIICTFLGFPDSISGEESRIIGHIYNLSKKFAVKDGTISFKYTSQGISAETSSKFNSALASEIETALGDDNCSGCTSTNVLIYWAIDQIRNQLGYQISATNPGDGKLSINVSLLHTVGNSVINRL